jgi:hypothetical protein
MQPNFLLIGAPRSGTTSTYEGIKQHPQIFMSAVKEPMFFILEGTHQEFSGPQIPVGARTWDAYCALFEGVRQEKAVGEASTFYLYSPDAPRRIRNRLPEAKFIAILRNPVDRAYSHFLVNRLAGTEPIADFEKAMDAEEQRMGQGWYLYWCYRGMGFYGGQIERYYSVFDRRQFRFFLFEDLVRDPDAFFADVFRFLEVDAHFRIRGRRKYNPSGLPRNRILHNFITQPNTLKLFFKRILPADMQYRMITSSLNRTLAKPALDGAVRRRLTDIYREDILRAQELLQRDLSSWLAVEGTDDA